ncbi:MAG: hypothetical protein ABIG89_01200 [Candidatus Woesearchaeota archaeon]
MIIDNNNNNNNSTGYNYETIINNLSIEYRLRYNNHHFLSIIRDGKVFIIRPHPYQHPNSWGSSLYMSPFFPDNENLNTEIINVVQNIDNLTISASGNVFENKNKIGEWSIDMLVTFDKTISCVKGEGKYHIKLSSNPVNLNLCRIASNFLSDVPLLSGDKGNTGDMLYAIIMGDNYSLRWYPHLQSEHFPQDTSQKIDIIVVGNYNNIDTYAQGYEPIEPALKPSISLTFKSEDNLSFLFGGMYNKSEKEQFWSDNVGIVVYLKKSPVEFTLNLSFLSHII